MPILTLKRNVPYGMVRRVRIEMDGNVVATLWQKQETNIKVVEGKHTLVAKMGWGKSKPLTLDFTGDSCKSVVVGGLTLLEAASNIWIPPFTTLTLIESS